MLDFVDETVLCVSLDDDDEQLHKQRLTFAQRVTLTGLYVNVDLIE